MTARKFCPRIHIASLAAAVLTLLGVTANATVLGYYPFDADFNDASGNANHLIGPDAGVGVAITTAVGEHRFGGGGLDLSSEILNQAYLDLSVPLSFGVGDAWTVSFWARNRPGTDGRTGMIVGDQTASNFIWIPGAGAITGLRFRNDVNGNADYDGFADDNEFHHWVVVADGAGNVTVYRDNVSLGTILIDTAFVITSVGQGFNSTTQSMNGQIDELYVFGAAVDAPAVTALFTSNTPPAPATAPLIAHYSFDSDFTDSSANSNDLTEVVPPPTSAPTTITTAAGEHMFGGGAADFDSLLSDAAYLELTSNLSFGASDPWSVVFWARHRPDNDGRSGMIVGDLTNRDFIWIPRDGAVDGLRFRNSLTGDADFTTPPDGVEPAGDFHHFAVIADGVGNVEVYYDNVSLGSIAYDTTFDITSVGHGFNQNTQSMNGQIDELYIYDEAIDATEVSRLFEGGDLGPEFVITSFSVSENRVTVRWNSIEDADYAVRFSRDMTNWDGDFDDSISGDPGDQTERSFDLEPLALGEGARLFIRVERSP